MLKQIHVNDLKLGMFIHGFCGSWIDHPFWRSSFLLESSQDLERIRASNVSELWIDLRRSIPDVRAEYLSTVQAFVPETGLEEIPAIYEGPESQAEADISGQDVVRVAHQPQTSLDEELLFAVGLCERSRQAVVDMFQDARLGKAVQWGPATELVEEISCSVMRNADALISLVRLKSADEYTYMHSVAVSALMIALAAELGFDEEQKREAGLSGLLHDIGKMAIPERILNKPGPLTDEEMVVIREHPEAGGRILQKGLPPVSSGVLDVCLHHHEKMDGTGYPGRLQGEQITLQARMGAVCDVYDAVTSNRVYRKPWGAAEAMQRMASWKGHFDESVFHSFVRAVGIYPTGSLVLLASGLLGVVLEQHETHLLRPRVMVFLQGKSRQRIRPRVIDLGGADSADRIVSRESAADWGIHDLDALWTGRSTASLLESRQKPRIC